MRDPPPPPRARGAPSVMFCCKIAGAFCFFRVLCVPCTRTLCTPYVPSVCPPPPPRPVGPNFSHHNARVQAMGWLPVGNQETGQQTFCCPPPPPSQEPKG